MAQGFAGSGQSVTVNVGGATNTLGMSNLGNTAGTSGVISGSNLQMLFAGGSNVTLSQSINGASATLSIAAQSQSVQTQNMVSLLGSTGNISLDNANGITFGGNASTITASHNALTSQSVQTQSNVQGISAGTGVGRTGDIIFADSNGISFGLSGGSRVTASYTVPAVPAQTVESQTFGMSNLGNTSGTSGVASGGQVRVLFAGGNNITLSQSLNGASATITVSAFNQSVQTQNLVSLLGSTGAISLQNSNGITFGGNNSTITASHNGLTSQSNQAVSAANGSSTFQTLSLANSNGVSFSTGTQGLYASHNGLTSQSGQALSGSNGSFAFQTATFGNLNGVSFYSSNGSLVASHNGLTSQSNQQLSAYAAGNTTQSSSGALNASNLSFRGEGVASVGVSNGSVVVSVPSGGGGAGTNTLGMSNLGNTVGTSGVISGTNLAMYLAGGNNVTLSQSINGSSATLSISGQNVDVSIGMDAAGNTLGEAGLVGLGNAGRFQFVGGSNITLSQSLQTSINRGTITIIGPTPGGGGGYSLFDYQNIDRISMNNITNMTATGVTQRPILIPFELGGSLTHNALHFEASRATNGSNAFTVQAALYTFVASNSISRLASLQNVFSNTDTGSISGVRLFRLTGWETAGTALTPGHYVMMLYASATATASMNYSWRGGGTVAPPVGLIGGGTDAVTTANLSSVSWKGFNGRYTATTISPPDAIHISQVQQWTSGGSIYFNLART